MKDLFTTLLSLSLPTQITHIMGSTTLTVSTFRVAHLTFTFRVWEDTVDGVLRSTTWAQKVETHNLDTGESFQDTPEEVSNLGLLAA
ncbi:MAG: hypothetical protein KAT70_08095 [Thermoplasmata archaeon]|nr:hypothetical protein [Thermoplasmata archaeon]